MTAPSRLFGQPAAERLWSDLDGALDEVADYRDDYPIEVTIEEWSVHSPQAHLPSASAVVEAIIEHGIEHETDEGWWEDTRGIDSQADVLGAAQHLLDVIASKINYRMANEQVAIHKVVLTEPGEYVGVATDAD